MLSPKVLHYNHKTIQAFFFQIKKLRVGEVTSPVLLPLSLVMITVGFVPTCICTHVYPNQCSPLSLLCSQIHASWPPHLAATETLIETVSSSPNCTNTEDQRKVSGFHFEHRLSKKEILVWSRWLSNFSLCSFCLLRTCYCKQLTLVECFLWAKHCTKQLYLHCLVFTTLIIVSP